MNAHVTPVSVAIVLIAPFVQAANADEVYLSRGAYGEASFADFALADAVVVQIAVHQPSAGQADTVRYRTVQALAMAAELEDARLAREKRYAESRERATRQAQRVTEYPREEHRHVVSFGYPRRHMRFHTVARAEPKPKPQPPRGKPLRWRSGHPGH